MESEMMTYLIAYDLHNPREKHSQLVGALRHKGAKRILSQTWALQTNSSATQIRNWLLQFLDTKDRFVISGISECVSHNPIAEVPQL